MSSSFPILEWVSRNADKCHVPPTPLPRSTPPGSPPSPDSQRSTAPAPYYRVQRQTVSMWTPNKGCWGVLGRRSSWGTARHTTQLCYFVTGGLPVPGQIAGDAHLAMHCDIRHSLLNIGIKTHHYSREQVLPIAVGV